MLKLNSIGEVRKHFKVPEEAIAFVEEICADTPNGRYDFGDACYVAVSSYDTKILNESLMPEAHEAYVDVQYLAVGEERILYIDKEKLTLTVPYDAQKDVAFYQYDSRASRVCFSVGEAVVLDTPDAHLPGLAVAEPCFVKKAVMKLKKGCV